MLQHAWKNTEYYREILSDSGVVRDGIVVDLDRFEDIPFLTKDILQKDGSRMKARVLPRGRKTYVNRTGGSTGEPLEFWQDIYYDAVNIANKLYHFEMLGKEIGEREMKVWGSKRDLFKGTIGLSAKLKNFLYNRMIHNCFRLSEKDICTIIESINIFKPKIIWGYIDGMYMIAEYANRIGMSLHSPAAIFCGGGTFCPYTEKIIEQAFHCPVINILRLQGNGCYCMPV